MGSVASRAWVVAIANPYNGPDTQAFCPAATYNIAMANLKNMGGHVIGYVPSGYAGTKMIAGDTTSCKASASGGIVFTSQDIIDCAEKYQAYYGSNIEGIFIDEMGTTGDLNAAINFYSAVYNGIKAKHPFWTIIGNPGGGISERYLNVVDTLVTFENSAMFYSGENPQTYQSSGTSLRFGAIAYSGTQADFSNYLSQTRSRNVSYIYYTDRSDFFDLPRNWMAQIDAIVTINSGAK